MVLLFQLLQYFFVHWYDARSGPSAALISWHKRCYTPTTLLEFRLGLRVGEKQNASGGPRMAKFLKWKGGHRLVNFQDVRLQRRCAQTPSESTALSQHEEETGANECKH